MRLPGKTAAAIDALARAMLRRRSTRTVTQVMHDNTVSLRIVTNGIRRAPRRLGFVHNQAADARLLIERTREWSTALAAARQAGASGNVDFPIDRLQTADREAGRIGVDRQAFIRLRLADALTRAS